jgi:metal-sulfur cluster biosynthetic enzyme
MSETPERPAELPLAAEPAPHATHPAPAAARPDDRPAPAAEPAGDEALLNPDVVRVALRKVKDPELSLNIIDLGLVYDVRVDGGKVAVDMSLTSPGCPSGPEIMTEAEQRVREIPEVEDVTVNLVWSPMWTPDRIEPRVRAYLGF